MRTSALSHPRPEDLLLQSPEARIGPSAAIAGDYHTFGHFYQLNHRETQTQFHCHTKTAAHTQESPTAPFVTLHRNPALTTSPPSYTHIEAIQAKTETGTR